MPNPPLSKGAIGFFGKLPTRGDFLRVDLPRSFVDPWDEWLQRVLEASRAALGEAWVPAWLEAPIWRFALTPGICGPNGVGGVLMPSVDSAGRYFPLTLAGIGLESGAGARFLATAEAAGLEAVTLGLEPDALAARLAACAAAGESLPSSPAQGSLWWTEGAPRRGPLTLTLPGLPGGLLFTHMLAEPEAGDPQ